MLRWSQVWRYMRSLTGRDIEKRAVMEFINYFEGQMELVVRECVRVLDRRNRFYRIQGLREKRRIDGECMVEAIKNISGGANPSMPGRAGGRERGEGEGYEGQPKKLRRSGGSRSREPRPRRG